MLEAVHKETGEPFYAAQIWKHFDNPRNEKWVCCPEEENEVTPVESYTREMNDKKIPVTSFFRHESDERCHYGESDKHKRYKQLIASLVEDGRLKLTTNNQTIKIEELDTKNILTEIDYRWELEAEKEKEIGDRRPDVRIPFSSFHPFFGKGLAFEVQLSPIKEKEKRERTKDLVNSKWSVIWLDEKHFSESEYSLTVEKLEVKNTFLPKFVEFVTDEINEMKNEYKNIIKRIPKMKERMKKEIHEKKEEIQKKPVKSCRTCKQGDWDEDNGKKTGLIACFRKWNNNTHSGTVTKHEPLDTCDHWERD